MSEVWRRKKRVPVLEEQEEEEQEASLARVVEARLLGFQFQRGGEGFSLDGVSRELALRLLSSRRMHNVEKVPNVEGGSHKEKCVDEGNCACDCLPPSPYRQSRVSVCGLNEIFLPILTRRA